LPSIRKDWRPNIGMKRMPWPRNQTIAGREPSISCQAMPSFDWCRVTFISAS
jgi:hypothetical protein